MPILSFFSVIGARDKPIVIRVYQYETSAKATWASSHTSQLPRIEKWETKWQDEAVVRGPHKTQTRKTTGKWSLSVTPMTVKNRTSCLLKTALHHSIVKWELTKELQFGKNLRKYTRWKNTKKQQTDTFSPHRSTRSSLVKNEKKTHQTLLLLKINFLNNRRTSPFWMRY